MVAEIESRLASIAEACRKYGVERLEVFGSAARGESNSEFRDVDFLVTFKHPELPGYADRYWELAESLERILGRPVDLLTERSVRNPVFARTINRDRQKVYYAA